MNNSWRLAYSHWSLKMLLWSQKSPRCTRVQFCSTWNIKCNIDLAILLIVAINLPILWWSIFSAEMAIASALSQNDCICIFSYLHLSIKNIAFYGKYASSFTPLTSGLLEWLNPSNSTSELFIYGNFSLKSAAARIICFQYSDMES